MSRSPSGRDKWITEAASRVLGVNKDQSQLSRSFTLLTNGLRGLPRSGGVWGLDSRWWWAFQYGCNVSKLTIPLTPYRRSTRRHINVGRSWVLFFQLQTEVFVLGLRKYVKRLCIYFHSGPSVEVNYGCSRWYLSCSGIENVTSIASNPQSSTMAAGSP